MDKLVFFIKDNGYWIVSLEYNPIQSVNSISKGLLNVGYRWNLDETPFK